MIDCTAYRRALLADPRDQSEELRAHRAACAACAEFSARLERFEMRLERAARVPAASARAASGGPRGPGDELARRRARRGFGGRGRLALAASVLLGVGIVGALWLAVPRTTLADAVVAHMAEEPQAWRRTEVPVPDARLEAVLRNTHVRLSSRTGLVSYANSCLFRGHHVPHFVVQSDRGPVTVMILVHERVAAPVHFDEQGYRGVIMPVPGHGAMAVLTRGAGDGPAFVAQVARRLLASLVWTG